MFQVSKQSHDLSRTSVAYKSSPWGHQHHEINSTAQGRKGNLATNKPLKKTYFSTFLIHPIQSFRIALGWALQKAAQPGTTSCSRLFERAGQLLAGSFFCFFQPFLRNSKNNNKLKLVFQFCFELAALLQPTTSSPAACIGFPAVNEYQQQNAGPLILR